MNAADLVGRRTQDAKWLLVLAAVPAMLFALVGIAYGAFLMYASVAAVCIVQIFYPTLLGWAAVTLIAWIAFGSYAYLAVVDAMRLVSGAQPTVFLNEGDTIGFLLLVCILAAVAIGLTLKRPKRIGPRREDA